jgi:hypothetical protein
MANKKISELTALGGTPASDDVVPVVDTSTSTTKKVTVSNLLASKADSSHTHAISDVTNLQTSLDAKQATVTAGDGLSFSGDTLNAEVTQAELDAKQAAPSEGAFVDGDKTKLDGIETSADVTDATNVEAAGALMDSELTDLAGVKGVTISTLQPKPSEGAFADGDKTKLDGITASANNYSHPNHTGDVTSTGDGATVIANNAVTTDKIADDAVTAAKIADTSVTAGSYTNADITVDAQGRITAASSGSGGGGGGSGTVTSVGGTGTVSGLTLSGTVTSSGNLTLGGTLSANLTSDVTGTLPVANGGTGLTSIATLLNSNTTASDVGLGSVEDTALSTWAGSTNLTTLGTIATGTWQGTAIADSYVSSASTWNGKIANVSEDTTPQLGGDLDVNGQDIVSTSNADIEIAPNGTGATVFKGNTNAGAIKLNCESNSHGQTIIAQPHSAAVTNTLTLPAGSDQEIVGTSATQTLSNKTITGLVIGTDVQAYDADTSKTDVATEWSAAQNFNSTQLTFDATQDWDLSTNQVCELTLTNNTTFDAPTNIQDGGFYSITLIQDSTGSRTAAWDAVFKWAGGTAPTLTTTASAKDILVFRGDGTNLLEVGRQLNVS